MPRRWSPPSQSPQAVKREPQNPLQTCDSPSTRQAGSPESGNDSSGIEWQRLAARGRWAARAGRRLRTADFPTEWRIAGQGNMTCCESMKQGSVRTSTRCHLKDDSRGRLSCFAISTRRRSPDAASQCGKRLEVPRVRMILAETSSKRSGATAPRPPPRR